MGNEKQKSAGIDFHKEYLIQQIMNVLRDCPPPYLQGVYLSVLSRRENLPSQPKTTPDALCLRRSSFKFLNGVVVAAADIAGANF